MLFRSSFQATLHRDFARFIEYQYPKWLSNPQGDRPPLSVDVCSEFLVPLLQERGSVMFVVVDCLRLDQWGSLMPLVTELFDVEESYYYSILPSATPFARNSIFSGLFPVETKVAKLLTCRLERLGALAADLPNQPLSHDRNHRRTRQIGLHT